MNRRSFCSSTAALVGAGALPAVLPAQQQTKLKGRLKQGVARWCFGKMSVEDLARESARLGIKGMDLIGPDDWPVVKKYGLTPSMVSGAGTIPDGWNRKENHAKLEQQMRENIERAAANNVPNVITFSGNRKGMADAEGLENCVIGLNKVKAIAEDKGITICMELLNSKVNHPDYMCDKTPWGVEVCKQVNSPRVKLLYDIYHMQIMEGDVIRNIRTYMQYIGHFHTGGNPGRNEIDGTQELNYRAIAQAIAELKFEGFVSHEFVPKKESDPVKSLAEAVEICDV